MHANCTQLFAFPKICIVFDFSVNANNFLPTFVTKIHIDLKYPGGVSDGNNDTGGIKE